MMWAQPWDRPTFSPTTMPTSSPSDEPTFDPTTKPSVMPTGFPTDVPTTLTPTQSPVMPGTPHVTTARAACEEAGFTHIEEVDGALICKVASDSDSCDDSCDTLRMYAYEDGGRDNDHNDETYSSKAGKYYSGHTGCTPGWASMNECGRWNSGWVDIPHGFVINCMHMEST